MSFEKTNPEQEGIIGYDLFDYDATHEQLKQLTELEKELRVSEDEIKDRDFAREYLTMCYFGKKKQNCPMKQLDFVLGGDGNGRKARRAVELIAKTTDSVITYDNTGYYICSNNEEIRHANDVIKSRVRSGIIRMFANGSLDHDELHALIGACKKRFPKIAEGQVNIKGEEHTHIFKKGE